MATAEEVLNISRGYVGEGPDRFWNWYPAPAGTAWCCIYQSYVLTEAGIPTHYAWVSGLFDQYRSEGRNSYDVRIAQAGDLIAFEWDRTGQNSYDHIAMVESVDANGVTAINGNWGGHVTRAWHSFNGGGIAEISRPPYSEDPKQEDDEMKSLIMIDRRVSPSPVYHACGNTKVWLSKQEQVDVLRFLGVAVVDPAPPAWLDSLATIPRG